MRESLDKFCRSRRGMVTAAGVLVLLACVAGVFGYCYVGPISIDEADLISAKVNVVLCDQDIPIDLTDPARREEVAGLLNGLHRWHGAATEGVPYATLEVTVRAGLTYGVIWWDNDDLELMVDGGEPDREIPRMWVSSGDMMRFLKQYYERYYGP